MMAGNILWTTRRREGGENQRRKPEAESQVGKPWHANNVAGNIAEIIDKIVTKNHKGLIVFV